MITDFIEYLQQIQVSGMVAELKFRGEKEEILTVRAKISELSALGDDPYLRTDSGMVWPLERLVQANGRPADTIC